MSFTSFGAQPLRTREQIASEIHQVSLARGLDVLATVMACMCVATEVGATNPQGVYGWWCPANPTNWAASMPFPHDSESNDSRSSGYFQQQPGPNGEPWWGTTADMMTLASAANTFLDRLTDNWEAAANNPAMAGGFVADVQDCRGDLRYRYAQHWDEAWDVVNRALATPAPTPPPAPPASGGIVTRPDFNEYPLWSPNCESRNGIKPTLFLLHTEEPCGYDNADGLSRNVLDNPATQVSYHFAISKGQFDDGVTLVDVVPTNQAAWSVGDANHQSINLCFAGSHADWTRDQWMANVGRAIDVAAYVAVRECRAAGIPLLVIPPPYTAGRAGISDHRYVTDVIGWGTHTDVGGPMGPPWTQFPWDYFTDSVNKYANS